MTGHMGIPDAAVKAAIEARSDHGLDPQPYSHARCRCGANFVTATAQLEHAIRKSIGAALPHIACSCFVISDVDDWCPQHGRNT
jgi:hypothetical protein